MHGWLSGLQLARRYLTGEYVHMLSNAPVTSQMLTPLTPLPPSAEPSTMIASLQMRSTDICVSGCNHISEGSFAGKGT